MADPIKFTPAEEFLIDLALPCECCGDALCDGFCPDADNELIEK